MRHFVLGKLTWALLLACCIGPATPSVAQAQSLPETQGQTAVAQKAPGNPLIQIEITPGNPTTQPAALPQENRIKQHAELLKQAKSQNKHTETPSESEAPKT